MAAAAIAQDFGDFGPAAGSICFQHGVTDASRSCA
jgi:hypothetical protein